MARPKEALIIPREVIAVALQIVDEDGLDALSMRRLAARLGVNAASLYYRFRDKDEILNEVLRRVLSDVRKTPIGTSWQESILESSLRYRRALLKHPNIIPVLGSRHQRELAYDMYDQFAQQLEVKGVPPSLIYSIIDQAEALALGSAMFAAGGPDVEFVDVPENCESLQRAIDARPADSEVGFVVVLRALIDGLEALVEQHPTAKRRRS